MPFKPFQPKGEIPEWRMIYNGVVEDGLDPDRIVTYSKLDEILSRTFLKNRSPIYRARRELETEHQRTMEALPTKGYRIVPARENRRLARREHKQSKRHLSRGIDILKATDHRQLSPAERQSNDAMLLVVALHHRAIEHIDGRLHKAETALSTIRTKQATDQQMTTARLHRIEDALGDLGIEFDPDEGSSDEGPEEA